MSTNCFDRSMELTAKAGAVSCKFAEVSTAWTNHFACETNFRMRAQARRHLKWFVWAAFNAPSRLTLLATTIAGAVVKAHVCGADPCE